VQTALAWQVAEPMVFVLTFVLLLSSHAGQYVGAPMPRWIVDCAHCREEFTHTDIDKIGGVFARDPSWPPKPEFPEGGTELKCPHCKEASTYRAVDLRYEASRRVRPGQTSVFLQPENIQMYLDLEAAKARLLECRWLSVFVIGLFISLNSGVRPDML